MTTLGELLTQLQDEAGIVDILAGLTDRAATASLTKLAHATDCGLRDAAVNAVQAFSAAASDEAWLKLIGQIQNADSPAATCLAEMIAWSYARRDAQRS
ncbi:MAG: hypothetical protein K1X51_02485 [Rhodospirillaceae bacterium]|nr:hypothetical protein [Rhodospirillaceae bacterium]